MILAHHISLVAYRLYGSSRYSDWQRTLKENYESPEQGKIPKLTYTSGVMCTVLKKGKIKEPVSNKNGSLS